MKRSQALDSVRGNEWRHFWLVLFYCNFIVLALTLDKNEGKFHVLESKILEWFGLRSYGIYLLHKPIQILIPFALAWLLGDTPSAWTLVIISLIVLFVVSELSYRIIEKPIMVWGHRFKYDPIENRPAEVVEPRPA